MDETSGGIPLKEIGIEDQAFSQARVRIEKSQRIKTDLRGEVNKPKSPLYQQRVAEIRQIELNSEQGDAGRAKTTEELVIDTRGYEEQRMKLQYKSPKGDSIQEELVMFVKLGTNGQPEFLRDQLGRTLALNADLYDSRLFSQKHAQGIDYKRTVIPRVDGRGAYTGVVSIIEDKNTNPNPPIVEKLQKEDLTKQIQPILNRLKSHQPNTLVRFGIEETLNPQEIANIQKVLTQAEAILNSKPVYQELMKLIDQFRGKDKAFDIALGFGTAVQEDKTLNYPQVINTSAGPVIKTPSEMYRLWTVRRKLKGVQTILTEYNKKPMDRNSGNLAYGTRVEPFTKDLENSLSEIQK